MVGLGQNKVLKKMKEKKYSFVYNFFSNVSNEKKKVDTGLVANIQTVILPFSAMV